MRAIKCFYVLAVIASLFIAAPSHALIPGVEYIDFTGWDNTLIDNGVGQTFTNVFPGIGLGVVDVTVTATGDFSSPSKYQAGWIKDGLLNTNEADTFRFTFSKTIPTLVVKTGTVDRQEQVDIMGVGPETYFHDSGAVPTITPMGTSGITIQGTSVGQGATGASMGETTTVAQAGLPVVVRHKSLPPFKNKYESFMIGAIPIPEPGSLSLFGWGVLGLLGLRRRG